MIPSRKQSVTSVTSVNSTGSTFRRPRPICIDKGLKAKKFNAHRFREVFFSLEILVLLVGWVRGTKKGLVAQFFPPMLVTMLGERRISILNRRSFSYSL
jgi:hypothetical protein